MARNKNARPRHSFYKLRENDYKMFEDGKFNPNTPRSYNFILGFTDRNRGYNTEKIESTIEIMK